MLLATRNSAECRIFATAPNWLISGWNGDGSTPALAILKVRVRNMTPRNAPSPRDKTANLFFIIKLPIKWPFDFQI